MCGIFGKIGKKSIDINTCIQSISHRGPDACHAVELEDAQLAHCRLSIIDTENRSDQPMCDETKRYWIIYNGEIYNYIELKNELKNKGYKFRTKSDTEVILYAYIEWGSGFQNKCNGMWGLAIWDSLKKELFLSRDRFGVKPLYYYYEKEMFCIGSEMKSFFSVMMNRSINYEIFDQKNWFGYEATSECVIKGINRIPAGHYAYYSQGDLKIKRWWNTLDHLIEVPLKYEEQVEELRELFVDSCRIRMRSDVPIGTALSGGIDSSAVAGCIKSISTGIKNEKTQLLQNAFVASMPYSIIDETKYAELTAERVGIHIHKVPICGNVTPDELMKYMYLCEDPYITPPIPFIKTYGEMRKKGIKVTIDGHGADELFGGYSFDLFALAGDDFDDNTRKAILDTYNSAVLPEGRLSYEEFIKKAVEMRIDNKSNSEKWYKLDRFNKTLYNEVHYITLPTLLRNYDRYSMCNGVEIRMPFMDYRIVTYAFSISWSSKIRNGYTKRIIRDMAKPFVIDEIVKKKGKIGFNAPMTEWIRGDMKELLMDTIHSQEFIECDLVNPLSATVLMERVLDNECPTFDDGVNLWLSVMPFFWEKAMFG